MTNRQQRRAAAAASRKHPRMSRGSDVSIGDIPKRFDICVEGKATAAGPVVMIYANAKGQRVVEDLCPDVQWMRDVHFAWYPPEWKFTHVRVTQLPPHLAATGIRPDEAVPDSLGMAVAFALAPMAEPRRVVHILGDDTTGLRLQVYDQSPSAENRKLARELFVEYVPSGAITTGSA